MDKHLKEAIELYERNIKSGELFYMDANTLVDIENYYEKQNKDYEAEQCLRFAKQLHPDNEEVLITEAYRLKMKGKYSDAYRLIKSLPNQNHSEVQLFYIEWYVMGGQVEKAMDIYKKYMKIPCPDLERYNFMLDTGEVLADFSYFKRAIEILSKIPSSHPEYKHALELLADAYYQTDDFSKAEQFTQQMVDLNPYDAYSWAQLADVQQKIGNDEEALESCEYALAIDPDLRPARTMKVFEMLRLSKTDEALQLIEDYKADMPDEYAMFMYAGGALYEKQQFDKAVPYFEHALTYCPLAIPDRQNIVTDLSLCFAILGRLSEGVELYKTIAPRPGDILDYYKRLFNLLDECKRKKEAINILSIMVDVKIEEGLVVDDIYDTLMQKQWFREAEDVWEKLLKLPTPPDEDGKYECIRLRAAMALLDSTDFIDTLKRIVDLYPIQADELIDSMESRGHMLPRKSNGELDYKAIGLEILRAKMQRDGL